MKRLILLASIVFFINHNSSGQAVGISGTSIVPNSHSILDIESTTTGVLLPRLTNSERGVLGSAMGTTEEGMVVYDKDDDIYYYWDGVVWVGMGSTATGAFVENQNAYQQVADFNIGGDGITSKLGVGTAMTPLGAQVHIHDGDPTGGNTTMLVEDFVGNPIMSVIDYGHVGIGTSAPSNNAKLDVTGNQGVLLPRMTTAAKNTYGAGLGVIDEGMVVYDLTQKQYNWWDGANWIALGPSSGLYIDNQNAVLQPADYRIAGLGVASQMGIGTGMGAILASGHIHDDNTAAGNQLFLADDYVGNPIMSIFDVGNIGLGNNTPNPNAILDVQDVNRGVLLPRLTAAQKATLTTGLGVAEEGLMIYDLNLQTYDFWDGAAWSSAGSGPGSFIDNQNTGVQTADFNIGGVGVVDKLGVGTGLGPVIGLAHLMDNSPTAGSRLLTIDDFVGLPLLTVNDAGQLGLGTTAPAGSAMLDMNSNNKGFLPPRMTAAQRAAIAGPVQGLVVYQTTGPDIGLWHYDGAIWRFIGAPTLITALIDADGDTKVEVEQATDEDIVRFTTYGTEYFNMDKGRLNVTNTGESTFLGDGAGANDDLTTNRNVTVGYQAGNANITGSTNTYVGYKAGLNSTRSFNTALGGYALEQNTTGQYNTAIGTTALSNSTTASSNTAVGQLAMASTTSGSSNVAIGRRAMYSNTSGGNNIGIGYQALYQNTTGAENLAIGHNSGFANTVGIYNSSVGTRSLYSNTTGQDNSAYGWESLYSNSTGNYNVAFGGGTLRSNSTGEKNAALGFEALKSATSADQNTAIGARALTSTTTGAENTGVGHNALYNNTTASQNTALGTNSLYANTTGWDNSAIGHDALKTNTTGYSNTAMGNNAMLVSTTGYANTAIGKDAMSAATTAFLNTSVGMNSMPNLTTGNSNAAVGYSALYLSTTGSDNTAIGHGAGHLITTGSNNTCVGKSANVLSTVNNSSAIGNGVTVTASNTIQLGNTSVTNIGGYANWTNLSDGRCKQNIQSDVPGLEFITKLRPVTYNLDLDAIAKIKGTPDSLRSKDAEKFKEQIVYTGLIAQEVEQAANQLNYNFSGVDLPENENDHYALRYAEFVPPLIQAVQELSEMNRDLRREVEVLRQQVALKDQKARK